MTQTDLADEMCPNLQDEKHRSTKEVKGELPNLVSALSRANEYGDGDNVNWENIVESLEFMLSHAQHRQCLQYAEEDDREAEKLDEEAD